MVTAATYQKQAIFRSPKRLTYLCETLLHLAATENWKLEAWAVFPNHYHFMATSPSAAQTLPRLIARLHSATAREVNLQDHTPGRRVWFQYWDTRLTFLRSYLARLNYVHTNAVRHGLAQRPEQYEWCSAGWFERTADRSFYKTVMQIRSDRVKVLDDFSVDPTDIE